MKESKARRREAGGHAHAKQFKHPRRIVKRPRTLLGSIRREIKRKLATATSES